MSFTKLILIAGLATVIYVYVLKPKDALSDGESGDKTPEVKKLSASEREQILKEVLSSTAKNVNAAGDESTTLSDYDIITDDELIAIKKMKDAERKSGKKLIGGTEFDAFIAKKNKDGALDKEDTTGNPLDKETGILDLGIVNEKFSNKITDAAGLEKKSAEYGLASSDVQTALPAIQKIKLISKKAKIAQQIPNKKLTIIDSSKNLGKKGSEGSPLGKKGSDTIGGMIGKKGDAEVNKNQCSLMAREFFKKKKFAAQARFSKEGAQQYGDELKKLEAEIAQNCGADYLKNLEKKAKDGSQEEFWKSDYENYGKPKERPKIFIKRGDGAQAKLIKKGKRAAFEKKYEGFADEDTEIFY